MVTDDYRRWKPFHPEINQRSGKLFNIKKFDAGFYGIYQMQAGNMYPVLGMVFETTFEAFGDVGYHPSELAGCNTGIVLSCCTSKSEHTCLYNVTPNSGVMSGQTIIKETLLLPEVEHNGALGAKQPVIDKPLYIDSIKSNSGHYEAASGLSAIIKVLIAIESGFIPPIIHFKKYRDEIEVFEKGRLEVVRKKIPWPDNNGLVGVNCFELGDANGHHLLRWHDKDEPNGPKR